MAVVGRIGLKTLQILELDPSFNNNREYGSEAVLSGVQLRRRTSGMKPPASAKYLFGESSDIGAWNRHGASS